MPKPLQFFAREDVSGYPLSDIDESVAIHPIFAQANFHPDIDYASLQLALRVASLALLSSPSLDFLRLLVFAPRQSIDLPDGTSHWHIAMEICDTPHDTALHAAVLTALDDLAAHVHFTKSTPTSKVHTSCKPILPTHGPLLQHGGYSSVITLPHFDLDELSTLYIPHRTLPPDYAAIYILSYKLVHTLFHEVAHAIGHYTATQPSLLEEAFIGNDSICEFGFAYEIAVFGGTFDWADSRGEVVYVYEDTEEKWIISVPGGKERKSKRVVNIVAVGAMAMGWDGVEVAEYSKRGFGLATRGEKVNKKAVMLWRLPFKSIPRIFSRDFWEVDVEEKGVKAFQLGNGKVGIERHDLPGGGVRYWLPEENKLAVRRCGCCSCAAERAKTKKQTTAWALFGKVFRGGVTWE
jgi:hypothetical protein